MIIKSMSRSEPSFGQLIDYMTDVKKSEEKYFVYHNVFGQKPVDLQAEFMANAKLVQHRKNGVYLYHEILSIKSPESLDKTTQKELLRDIAYDYAKQRANDCMVFGALHDDHDEHLHYHLCISANHCQSSKKHRMSKAEFDAFKKGLEQQVLQQYPQLEQQLTINRQAGEKLSQKGGEIKRRTGQTPQRDQLKATLASIFMDATDKQSFFEAMSQQGLEIYTRGKTIGVRDVAAERNHRLKTLGLLDSFNATSARIGLGAAEQPKATDAEKNAGQEDAQAYRDNQDNPDNWKDRVNLKDRNTESNENTQSTSSNEKTENHQANQKNQNTEHTQANQNSQSNRRNQGNQKRRYTEKPQSNQRNQNAESGSRAGPQQHRPENTGPEKPAADKPKSKASAQQEAMNAAYRRHRAQQAAEEQRKAEQQQNEKKDQSSQKHKPKQ